MKNKKLVGITSLLLSLFITMGSACASQTEFSPEVQKLTYSGKHNFTATDTSDYLVQNGRTQYTLVYPENPSAQIKAAKEEFEYFFKEATGITIRSVSDGNLTHSANNKYISLGETTLLESSGVEIDKSALTFEGVRIVTKDKTVFLCGGSDYGTVYAVYDFMKIMFNYEMYFTNCIEIDTGVTEAKLKNFDVTDIPDFEYRCSAYGFQNSKYDEYSSYRYRMPYGYGSLQLNIYEKWEDRENLVIDKNSAYKTAHNTLYYVPKEQYAADHPGWYSQNGRQLCYTARGDEEELELMAIECADKIKGSIIAFQPDEWPLKNQATLTMEDNNELCTCDFCDASKKKYGTDSAAVIIFMNMVNDNVQAWLEENKDQPYYREDFKILYFAYHGLTEAPAHYDEATGEYVANAPELELHDGLAVWMAPISTDYQQGIYSKQNEDFVANTRKWACLSDSLYLWTYATNFNYYMYMYDSFGFYTSETYQLLRACGGKMWFNQQQGSQVGSATAFHNLKAYLDYKLAWDSTLDYDVLIENWFDAMFREGAPYMKQLFLQERLHNSKISAENNLYNGASMYAPLEDRMYYPYTMLEKWTNLCDKALESVEKYKATDKELYDEIKFHIDAEWLSPAYAILQMYSNSLAPTELTALRKRFKEAALTTGISYTKEGSGSIEDYVKNF